MQTKKDEKDPKASDRRRIKEVKRRGDGDKKKNG
jgi:hypothetical protein